MLHEHRPPRSIVMEIIKNLEVKFQEDKYQSKHSLRIEDNSISTSIQLMGLADNGNM